MMNASLPPLFVEKVRNWMAREFYVIIGFETAF